MVKVFKPTDFTNDGEVSDYIVNKIKNKYDTVERISIKYNNDVCSINLIVDSEAFNFEFERSFKKTDIDNVLTDLFGYLG
jgi:Mg2+/Co2+ transporter CorC